MIENIRLAFQGVWGHKLRSLLTMLGIIIGIAAIIAIVSTIKGTNEQIKQNLIGSGSNLVEVKLYQNDYEYELQWQGAPEGVPVIKEDVRQQIAELAEVESASLYRYRQDYDNSVFYGNKGAESSVIIGADAHYLDTCGYQLMTGRGFTEKDFTQFSNVALIDDAMADQLFEGKPALGELLDIKGHPFRIVGVVKERDEFEPVINSIEDYYNYMSENTSGKVFVPTTVWPAIYSFDEPQYVAVRAKNTDAMTDAGKKTQDLLNASVTNQDGVKYKAEDLLEQAKNLQDLSASTNQQLIWIASISLLVGGIGVANIMLVSVTERTQEIGLKKAIGAKKRRIRAQFLTEAAVLTSIGGILGVAAGIGLAHLISRVTESPVAVDWFYAIVAVIGSMLIGVIAGFFPAVKASNLDPIEALRRE